MRNQFQSLPVDNEVYKLITEVAQRNSTTRTKFMNAILREYFGLDEVTEPIKKFNPIVNLKSKVAKSVDKDELTSLANKVLREAKKL